MIRLFNCDNMDFMRSVPDGFYELAICDVPYGIGAENHAGSVNNGWTQWPLKKWDSETPKESYFNELLRVSKNQIMWGGNYITDFLRPSKGWIVWDKGQRDFSLADGELAWTSFDKSLRIFDYARAKANQEDKIHPTQKPVALYKWLLKNYAKEGDKIFDSHGGSLSIAIACGEMGYSLDACELDVDYFKDSVARVQRHFTQSNAFMKTPEILVNPKFG